MNAFRRHFSFVARWVATISLVGTTALAVAAPVAADVCAKSWSGGDGLWTDGAHWTGGTAPLSTDSACLPAGFYTVTVDATTTAQAASLSVGLSSKLVVKGTTATTLTISGGATNAGTIEIGFGAPNSFHAQATLAVVGTLANTGTIAAIANGDELDAALNNLASGTLTTSAGTLTMGLPGSAITNSGTITVGGQLTIATGGVFTMAGGTVTNNSILSVNSGTFTHTGGSLTGFPIGLFGVTLNVDPSSGSGTFRVASTGNTLNSNVAVGETLIVEGGSLNNDGVLNSTDDRTNNGTIQLSSIDSSKTALLTFASGKTLTNAGTLESIQGTGSGGNRQLQANLDNQGTFFVNYPLDFNQASTTLTQSSGTTDLEATLNIIGSAGTFTLNGGNLQGNSNLTGNLNNVSGTVGPGTSPGFLSVSGDYAQGSGGTLAIQIGGSNPGTQSDRFIVSGAASLAGTLALTTINAFLPADSFNYDFLFYTTHTNAFDAVTGANVNGKQYTVHYNTTTANLTSSTVGPTRQPDGLITVGSHPFIGGNIYNSDGFNQAKSKTGNAGTTFTFKIRIGNDGTAKEKLKVHATGLIVNGYTVKFMKGSTNITTAVMNGTFTTVKISVGSYITIKCTVKIGSAANHSSSMDRLVTISSFNDPDQVDAVELIVGRN